MKQVEYDGFDNLGGVLVCGIWLSRYKVTSCGALKGLAKRDEKDRVMQFLIGLNDSFSTVCGSILMMNPLPDTQKAHALVLQHDRQAEVAAKRDITRHHAAHWCESKPQNWSTKGSRKNLHCCR